MKNSLTPVVLVLLLLPIACNKKQHPSKTASIIYSVEKPPASETNSSPKSYPSKTPETVDSKKIFPNSIYVNDDAAKKSVDGRLYYDVEGHRYWKNYKDGRYYLFNKSMYDNPDFRPPKKNI